MRFLKKILKNPLIIQAASFLIASYIKFVFKTSSWKWINQDIINKLKTDKIPFICCFWHNRLVMISQSQAIPHNKLHMLISAHRDGLLIAETVKYFGILTVSGSSSKGGTQALRKLIKLSKKGDYIGITPDGPRGPRFKARGGIIQIAKLSGYPILPLSYSITKRKILKSWDRFIFPLPFSKGVFIAGEPIYVPLTATEEEFQEALQKVENTLNHISDHADDLCGYLPFPQDNTR